MSSVDNPNVDPRPPRVLAGRRGAEIEEDIVRAWMPIAALGAALLGAVAGPSAIGADSTTTFRGCVVGQSSETLTLATGGGERVEIATGWLAPNDLASALTDCVTVRAVTVDGRYVAESIQAGDEPNEIRGVTNETTRDRVQRDRDRDDSGNKKSR
jgi:hypothetical protein